VTKAKFTQADMDAVSDNPEWTEDDFAKAVPFDQAFPEIAKTIRRRGAQKEPRKVSTTIRLSPEVVEHFRADGPGWQGRIDDALKEWVSTHR
jgi:uncharacterized protein (DUF4415 family)